MNFKYIKIFFFILFALDIAAGFALAHFLTILHGIVAAAVLLILNLTVFAIILKMQKIKEQNDGHAKKSGDL